MRKRGEIFLRHRHAADEQAKTGEKTDGDAQFGWNEIVVERVLDEKGDAEEQSESAEPGETFDPHELFPIDFWRGLVLRFRWSRKRWRRFGKNRPRHWRNGRRCDGRRSFRLNHCLGNENRFWWRDRSRRDRFWLRCRHGFHRLCHFAFSGLPQAVQLRFERAEAPGKFVNAILRAQGADNQPDNHCKWDSKKYQDDESNCRFHKFCLSTAERLGCRHCAPAASR